MLMRDYVFSARKARDIGSIDTHIRNSRFKSPLKPYRNWPPAFHTSRAPPPLAQAPGVRDPPPAAAGVWVHPRRRFACWLVLGLPATRPGWMAASRSNVVHTPGPIGRSSAANLGRREPQGIVRNGSSSTHYARETPDARLEHQEPLRLRDDSRSKSERPGRYCAEETA
ncbi:hypothetical protein ACCO45_013416 [Purpureocillium lilacinum]|uniref:Uncharacterized protein n=1 Tax=Purpureocillium lilacinum TaxID=33203 RepID=A0ACC4D7C6_PURLI